MRIVSHERLYAGLFIAFLSWACLISARNLQIDRCDDVADAESVCIYSAISGMADAPQTETVEPFQCILAGVLGLGLLLPYLVCANRSARVPIRNRHCSARYERGPPLGVFLLQPS